MNKKLFLLGLLAPALLSLASCTLPLNSETSSSSESSVVVDVNKLYFVAQNAEIKDIVYEGTTYQDILAVDVKVQNQTGKFIEKVVVKRVTIYVDDVQRADAFFGNERTYNVAYGEEIQDVFWFMNLETAKAYDYDFWSTLTGDFSSLNGLFVAEYEITSW